MRVAAIGDLHVQETDVAPYRELFAEISSNADVLALCGDLTNHGLPDEAQALVQELSAVGSLPVVAVLGNHDYEAGRVDEVRRIVDRKSVV